MVAAYLDPRSKELTTFGVEDKAKIVKETQIRALVVRAELVATAAAVAIPGKGAAHAVVVQDDTYHDLFDALENAGVAEAHEEQLPGAEGAEQEHNAFLYDVEREMQEYAAAPKIPRATQVNGKHVLNNPLEWWKVRCHKLPILSLLARRSLCVPATSAPSERLFSTAGLTIANARAGLLPDNAADLIFLHEAWPVMKEQVRRKRGLADMNN